MRILAIDGGGIRGLIPALVLAELEARTGRRIATLVDLVAGTSTGGILACALARPDPLPAARIADLYVQEGPRIFDRTLRRRIADGRYDAAGLVAALRRYLGDTVLGEATVPVLVTAYDVEARTAVLLRSADRGEVSMVDAALATAAAPAHFPPVRAGGMTLADGGIVAADPALVAYAEAEGARVDVLVSLGTGERTPPLPPEELTRVAGCLYVRLQARLDEASQEPDDASEGNLAALRREAERLIAAHDRELDALCARLVASG